MAAFLEEIMDDILEKHPGQTGDICIVTPNRRAGLFLRKYLAERVTEPIWAPDIFSIEDFINRMTGYEICDKLHLMLEFYDVYSDIEKEQAEEADSFFSWAPAVLRDFDDIDHALANRGKLYDHLVSARYIDTWNPDGSEMTAFQKKYLAFLNKLNTYHDRLADHLTTKGMAWQGLSSRKAAQMTSSGTAGLQWSKVVFTGFNALTHAEETVIKNLVREGKASYHIDADPYYADDPMHEAGRFIRKYSKTFNLQETFREKDFFGGGGKRINIYGVARQVNQARLAGNLLNDGKGLTRDEDTAVVLADENLLTPLLNALPESIESINVTMGYPLNKTNMFEFFDSLFKLQLNAYRPSSKKEKMAYHHKDLRRFFSNSLTMLNWEARQGRDLSLSLLQAINTSNLSYCTYENLCDLSQDEKSFAKAFSFLSSDWDAGSFDIFGALTELAGRFDRLLREKAAQQGKDIVKTPFFADFESLYHFAKMFRQMQGFTKRFPFLLQTKTLYRIIRQGASEMRLPFTGEPLEGLQVMGMLETRSLDFKNVLILSVNEDILPKPKTSHSLIPYDVKKSFGLRLYHDQDAIFAYHFYRLIQRAENVTMVYNTQTQDIGSSEKSRFVTQLQFELPQYNPRVQINEEIVSLPPPVDQKPAHIAIEKSPDILEKLDEISRKGFSPSALARFIQCPLHYYFERIAGIEETDAVEETLEARTLGSVIHAVLEEMYSPLAGKVIRTGDIDSMEKNLDALTEMSFQKEYSGGKMDTGKNLLLYHLTNRYLHNMLKAERQDIRDAAQVNRHITLVSVEEFLKATLLVPESSGQRQVTLRGLADRTDRKGDVVRIIDYKTGAVKQSELTFKDWSEPLNDPGKAKSFQLLCYAWLFHKNHPGETRLEPGIISTRTPGRGSLTLVHPEGKGVLEPGHLLLFEEALQQLVAHILDPSSPFTQTDDEENCRYCPFRVSCRRH